MLSVPLLVPSAVHGWWVSGWVFYDAGGGSFITCEDLWRMFDHLFPVCALVFFFFFEVEISSRTLILFSCQDLSTVAQRAETTVAECSLTGCA